jgi:O-antigen/teichoic acid export membrane protein
LSSFHRFLTNIIWTVFGKGCVQVILFAVSILITRYLGKEQLGVYATLLVIPAFVRLVNQFGLETLINKKLPELNVQDPSGKQARFLVRRLLIVRLVSSAMFCGVLYFFLPVYFSFIHMPELLSFRTALILYFGGITLESFLSTLFMTRLQFKTVSFVETASALLNLALLGIFIYLDFGIAGVLNAYVLSVGLNIAVYLLLSVQDLKGEQAAPKWQEMKRLAWASYWISLLSFGLMTQSDILLMNYFHVDPVSIGYYHLVTGLGGMAAFVLAGIGPLALSLFSEAYARESHTGLSRSWCEIVGFSAFLTVPIYVFVFFNSETLITFVYGDAFSEAAPLLSYYIVLLGISVVLGANFTVSTLFVLHRRDTAMRSTVEGSALNVGLNLIFIPLYGVMGAVVATGSVMVYMVVRQLLAIQKEMDIRPVFPVLGKCFLFSISAIAPTLILSRVLGDHLIGNGVIYLTAFFILLVWQKPFTEDHRDLITNVYPRLDPWVRCFVQAR